MRLVGDTVQITQNGLLPRVGVVRAILSRPWRAMTKVLVASLLMPVIGISLTGNALGRYSSLVMSESVVSRQVVPQGRPRLPRRRSRLLGVALATVLLLVPAVPAYAHANVESWDAGSNSPYFGDFGTILVNDLTYSNLYSSIFRNLFVWKNGSEDFESGWTANNCGSVTPVAYYEFKFDGNNHPPVCEPGVTLIKGDNYNWKLVDPRGDNTFNAYAGGVYLGSHTFAWAEGKSLTNSERYDGHDTMGGHFYGLENCTSVSSGCTNWTDHWQDLECWTNTSTDFILEKESNSEVWVKQIGSPLC